MKAAVKPVERSYMKGKSKHLFWPFIAFLVAVITYQAFQSTLISTLARIFGHNSHDVLYGIQAVAFAAVYLCGMAGFLLAYGIKSSVRVHRSVFIVLAVATLLPVAKGLLISINMMGRLQGISGLNDNLRTLIVNNANIVLPLVSSVAWISCLSVIAAGPRCGAVLRASAIILALAHLYLIINSIIMPMLVTYLSMQNSYDTYIFVNNAVKIVNSILQIATMAFFFAALSFSKPRPEKAAVPAETVPTA